MTIQTKQYIEPSDMLALKCTCKKCGTELTIALNSYATDSLKRCPKCGKGWTVVENTNHEDDIDYFARAAMKLSQIVGSLGFVPTIEIKTQ